MVWQAQQSGEQLTEPPVLKCPPSGCPWPNRCCSLRTPFLRQRLLSPSLPSQSEHTKTTPARSEADNAREKRLTLKHHTRSP